MVEDHKIEPKIDANSNIITFMFDCPSLSPKDKSVWRLALEMRTLVGAGTETTGNMLSATTFYLLSNPDKAKRLREEIQAAQRKSKTPLMYQDLQQLPYLVRSPKIHFDQIAN
jgi:cytochrome P450